MNDVCQRYYCYQPIHFIKVGFGNSVARVLEASRVHVSWIPVGICQGAIDKTIEYVNGRDAFGASLSSNQLIQGMCKSPVKSELIILTEMMAMFY